MSHNQEKLHTTKENPVVLEQCNSSSYFIRFNLCKAVEDAEIAVTVLQNKLLEAENSRREAEKSREDAVREFHEMQLELQKQVRNSAQPIQC